MVVFPGGINIYSESPDALALWYAENLGITAQHSPEYQCHYAIFPYTSPQSGQESVIVWSILKADKRPRIEGKAFCINYRVDDMSKTLEHLKAKGVEATEPQTFPEGVFAWLQDMDGNHIELWQELKEE